MTDSPAPRSRRLLIIVIVLVVLALPLVFLGLNGCTPIPVSDVIASQGNARVVQTRSIPLSRWTDFSFRLEYQIVLTRSDGSAQILYLTDNGSIGDRITVQALPSAQAGHQLTIRNSQNVVLSTTRFTFK